MARLRFALLFFLSSPSYVLKIPSHPHRLRRLTYRHKHAPPPQPPPTEFITNTDAIRRISLQHPPIHPSIQSIHPYLPPKRMEPRMLPLPQLLPLLKGTPAPFFGQPFSAETTDDIKKIYIREEKTELSSRAVALDSVFIYCRSALLQPSLYFAWQHWVARACAVGADRSVTWPAADCTATDREWR